MTREVSARELSLAEQIGRERRYRGADYLWVEPLADGRMLALLPWNGAGYQLSLGSFGLGWDDTWIYLAEMHAAAWRAALGWDGEGEPEGWYRHPASGRRRDDGDPRMEYIQR